MKPQVALRKIHHWTSPIILLPVGVVIIAGVLLMLKKDLDWIQPPTQKGQHPDSVPTRTLNELFATAQQVDALALNDWTDLSRVDVKTNKGIVKFVSHNRWEAQIDSHTGKVLQVAYRRSDLIEELHDGSFFADWVKRYVFLPSGILLFVLWVTGIYLFFVTQLARRRKTRRHLERQRSKKVPLGST